MNVAEFLTILDVPVHNLYESEFLERFISFIDQSEQRIIFFANAHSINVAQNDKHFLQALQDADLVLPDGIGLKIAGRIFGTPIKEDLGGTDLLPKVLALAEKRKLSIFLLGGEAGVSEKAKMEILCHFPSLNIVGTQHGFFNVSGSKNLIALINKMNPDILLVGMGVPLQEKWIWQFRKRIQARFLFGVGAFLDFSAKKIMRAPPIMRKIGMEWVYRFYKEPQRLFKRYIIGNPIFLYRIIGKRFFMNK